jgi:hypothetical protein
MERSWSNLHDDLLPVVYEKVIGLLQRVRFAAVCKSWRDATAESRQPALPWHISSFGGDHDRTKRVYRPDDGEVFGIQVPSVAVVERFLGAHDGGWIAALTRKHVRLVVVNLFSGVEVPLSIKQRKFVNTTTRDQDGPSAIEKVVFSQAPTSSDCILAALTSSRHVAVCRVGCPTDDGWIMRRSISETHKQSWFVEISLSAMENSMASPTTGNFFFETRQKLCLFD